MIRWMDGGVTRSPPGRVAVGLLCRQIEVVLVEPAERLSGTAQFLDLVEHQLDRFLDAPIRIFLIAVAGLHEADGRRHDQLAPARLLVARRERALAQQIQLVLVEAPLEPEQQAVVAVPWRIDGLLIDQNGVDHAAHLDELLPIPAVRAKRETSRAQTAPTLPRHTSATIRSKPARCTPPAAERPRSSSITSISDQPSAVSRSRMAYCSALLSRLCNT